jgi:hypothetical protein
VQNTFLHGGKIYEEIYDSICPSQEIIEITPHGYAMAYVE